MGSELLNPLMHQVASSPVFGDSFAISPAQQDIMAGQMGMAIRAFSEETTAIFSQGMPEAPAERVTELVKSLIVTSVGFGAGLSAGELQDTSLVADLAILIGVTGWGNFLCDQKDEPMTYAISLLCGREVEVPEHLVGQTHSRLDGLRHIESKIQKIARPEDVPYLLRASRDELMLCEILAHELSEGLAAANAQDSFLAKHAERAADILTVTAALPSAITPLYGAYRRENPDLPMLQEVYGDPLIHEFLRRANVFVRVFDDLGDRGIDQQAFSLNVFNQAQPEMLRAFFNRGGIAENDCEMLIHAFRNVDHPQAESLINTFFINHIRQFMEQLPPAFTGRFNKYIQLGKRALEAGYVNQVGYTAIGGSAIREAL